MIKGGRFPISLLILIAYVPASFGQSARPNLPGPALQDLQRMADDPGRVGEIVDNSLPRREGALVIVEEKPWEQRRFHPEQESSSSRSDYDYYYYHGSHGPVYHGNHYYHYSGCPHDYHHHSFPRQESHHARTGAYTEVERGTWQKVRIADRGSYVRWEAAKGGLWGLIGTVIAIGIATVLSGPVGIVAYVGLAATAATAGGFALTAMNKPDTYQRVVNRTTGSEKP